MRADPRNPARRDRALRETLHRRLLDAPFDPATLERPELRARLARMLREEAPLLTTATADVVLDELVDDVGGLGPLEPLLGDPSITEIMVNGADRVFVERGGRIVPVVCEIDAATIVRLVERVIAPLGLRLDRASPMVDARLADGSRLHAVLPPLAPDGPCLSIRRFAADAVPLAAFGLEPEAGAFFDAMVRAGWNHRGVGRDELGQDDVLQRARPRDRSHGTDRHDRGDGRAAARAAARRSARGAPGERRGNRRGQRARPGAQRAAHAPRPDRRRRGARR